MAIALTWRNIFTMIGLVAAVLTGVVAGTGAMVEWRVSAMQHQLADRLTLYQHQMENVERRLEVLEERH
jgi:hypothetical protein